MENGSAGHGLGIGGRQYYFPNTPNSMQTQCPSRRSVHFIGCPHSSLFGPPLCRSPHNPHCPIYPNRVTCRRKGRKKESSFVPPQPSVPSSSSSSTHNFQQVSPFQSPNVQFPSKPAMAKLLPMLLALIIVGLTAFVHGAADVQAEVAENLTTAAAASPTTPMPAWKARLEVAKADAKKRREEHLADREKFRKGYARWLKLPPAERKVELKKFLAERKKKREEDRKKRLEEIRKRAEELKNGGKKATSSPTPEVSSSVQAASSPEPEATSPVPAAVNATEAVAATTAELPAVTAEPRVDVVEQTATAGPAEQTPSPAPAEQTSPPTVQQTQPPSPVEEGTSVAAASSAAPLASSAAPSVVEAATPSAALETGNSVVEETGPTPGAAVVASTEASVGASTAAVCSCPCQTQQPAAPMETAPVAATAKEELAPAAEQTVLPQSATQQQQVQQQETVVPPQQQENSNQKAEENQPNDATVKRQAPASDEANQGQTAATTNVVQSESAQPVKETAEEPVALAQTSARPVASSAPTNVQTVPAAGKN